MGAPGRTHCAVRTARTGRALRLSSTPSHACASQECGRSFPASAPQRASRQAHQLFVSRTIHCWWARAPPRPAREPTCARRAGASPASIFGPMANGTCATGAARADARLTRRDGAAAPGARAANAHRNRAKRGLEKTRACPASRVSGFAPTHTAGWEHCLHLLFRVGAGPLECTGAAAACATSQVESYFLKLPTRGD